MTLNTANINWPAAFPNPNKTPYDYASRTGLERARMQNGVTKQRRVFNHLPTIFNLEFEAHTDAMSEMLKWMNAYGFDWFNINLVSDYTGVNGDIFEPTAARLIGDVSVTARGHDFWTINAPAELSPAVRRLIISIIENNNWVIGGRPSAPSTDWVIGGSPRIPSTDNVLAGTPGRPSALVK